ncbi:MAG: P27 family phage terminase small subunit [Gammaproteobacteria bacterium]
MIFRRRKRRGGTDQKTGRGKPYRLVIGSANSTAERTGTHRIALEDFQLLGLTDEVAQEVCRYIVPILQKERKLRQEEAPFLHRWCMAWSELIVAEKNLRDRGDTVNEENVLYDEAGIQVSETINQANPAIRERHEAWRQIESIAGALELTDDVLAAISLHINRKFLGDHNDEPGEDESYTIDL